jgi:hypothetical protein
MALHGESVASKRNGSPAGRNHNMTSNNNIEEMDLEAVQRELAAYQPGTSSELAELEEHRESGGSAARACRLPVRHVA